MVAAVLTLLWRDVAGGRELTRILAREGFLWCSPTQVSQPAMSQRFLTFPAELFERVFQQLLPKLRQAWQQRNNRLLPESIEFTLSKFERIWIADSSTLEALFGKLKSLADVPPGQLVGKNGVKLQIWGTWLFYAVLVDLGDAVADELSLPFDSISLEMIYRGLYHFYVAHQKGLASDPVKYFAAGENQDLGIVKQQRKPHVKLIVAPFPERQGSPSDTIYQK
jgi:hypothetical protein